MPRCQDLICPQFNGLNRHTGNWCSVGEFVSSVGRFAPDWSNFPAPMACRWPNFVDIGFAVDPRCPTSQFDRLVGCSLGFESVGRDQSYLHWNIYRYHWPWPVDGRMGASPAFEGRRTCGIIVHHWLERSKGLKVAHLISGVFTSKKSVG